MRILLLCVAVAFCLGGCARSSKTVPQAPPDLKIANSENPGEPIDLNAVAVKGKLTVVEFYSEQCPPCIKMAEVLDRLAKARPDIAIRRVNIDRRGQSQIDFDSPLAHQLKIESVPSFRIFEADGRQSAEGALAKEKVQEIYSQAQMFEQGQSDAGTRETMKQYEKSSVTARGARDVRSKNWLATLWFRNRVLSEKE